MTRILLSLAIVAVCSVATAAAGDAYVGASYMNSSVDIPTNAFFFPTQTTDSSSSGWKVFGGYNFMKYLGVEATYYDLGSYSASTTTSMAKADITVWDASFRGILPLGKRLELFGRLGYSSVESDFSYTGPPSNTNTSTREWELLYGVGASFFIGQRFGIRAEWEAWDIDSNLNAWSVGGFFRFGGN